jgi:hypothetical protein
LNFEDLLHVRGFVTSLSQFSELPPDQNLYKIFNNSRPSLYKLWVSKQSETVQLFLILLWLIKEVNQFVFDDDIRRIYNFLSSNSNTSILDSYFQSKSFLLKGDRVREYSNKRLDFVHPYLLSGVQTLIDDSEVFLNLLAKIKIKLISSDNPLDQSIVFCKRKQAHFNVENETTLDTVKIKINNENGPILTSKTSPFSA